MIEETMNGSAQPEVRAPNPNMQQQQQQQYNAIRNLKMLAYEALNSPAGKQLVEALTERHLMQQTWLPGCPEGYAEFRAGQNDIVFTMKKGLEEGLKGEFAPEQGTNNE